MNKIIDIALIIICLILSFCCFIIPNFIYGKIPALLGTIFCLMANIISNRNGRK